MSIDSDFSHLSNASHQPQDYLAVLQEIARSVRIVSRGRIEHPDLRACLENIHTLRLLGSESGQLIRKAAYLCTESGYSH